MRIKTITCHDVYNHGASLQAYALQRYLVEQGHEVEIIDYKPPYLNNYYRLSTISNPKYDRFLVRSLYLLAKLPGRLLSLKRKKAFDNFTATHLKLTTRRYDSNEALKKDCPIAEIYIAGSDQIWNTIFPNGRDAAFYLDFVPQGTKRASYAASFATEQIVEGYEDFVRGMVSKINCVSVREQTGVQILQELGIEGASQVCDPVFLLDKEEWSEIAPTEDGENYLLIYDSENSPLIKEIAITLAKRLNVKIYSVSPVRVDYADRNYNMSGPIKFVSLINNAEFIISNSFHGTAFSLIFEKNMCVVKRSEGINTRMQCLLDGLGMSDRLVGADYNIEDLIKKIDYSKVNEFLKETIVQSKQFLKETIGC